MAWPPKEEVAELTVNGQRYTDWESVLVKHMFNEQPPYFFRFTCSEGLPIAKNFWVLQIKPGDYCTIKLAGILAFSGYVHTRQVFYDGHRHYIEIQGASTLELSVASVITKGQEFTDKTPEEITRAVLAPLGIKLSVEGGSLPGKKIERVSVRPGTSTYNFLDQLWRDHAGDATNGINFTSNSNGDFVIVVGKVGGTDEVIESKNIIEARCLVFNSLMTGKAAHLGQRPGNNQVNGPQAASQLFHKDQTDNMGLKLPNIIVNEAPAWSVQNLQGRAFSEKRWNADDQITVHVTVHGWLRPSGGLWVRGQDVIVDSPMLIMPNEKLILKSATYTQDNKSGTRTTLDLRNEKAIGQSQPSL
jgi:prophage tail gpP-like protein